MAGTIRLGFRSPLTGYTKGCVSGDSSLNLDISLNVASAAFDEFANEELEHIFINYYNVAVAGYKGYGEN
jgi:hypothetical protein